MTGDTCWRNVAAGPCRQRRDGDGHMPCQLRAGCPQLRRLEPLAEREEPDFAARLESVNDAQAVS